MNKLKIITIHSFFLILLLILIVFTQDIKPCRTVSDTPDSTKVSSDDLKLTNGFLLELLWRRQNYQISNDIISDYKYLLGETNKKLDVKDLQLKQQIEIAEANLPSWYDHFWLGAVISSVIFIALILVIP